MRRGILVIVVLVTMPASAGAAGGAATVGREGSQVVYRTTPGAGIGVTVQDGAGGSVSFLNTGRGSLTPGPGCTGETTPREVLCTVSDVDSVRIVTTERKDVVRAEASLPVVIEVGDGRDLITVAAKSDITVLAGPGEDTIRARPGAGAIRLDGGDGNDFLSVSPREFLFASGEKSSSVDQRATIVVNGGGGNDDVYMTDSGGVISGGDGDDEIFHNGGARADVTCGPGSDTHGLEAYDRAGEGCAPLFSMRRGASSSQPVLGSFSASTRRITIRHGRVSRAATLRIRITRRPKGAPEKLLAISRVRVPAGRVRYLSLTPSGAKTLGRDPRIDVMVAAETRNPTGGGDRGRTGFLMRLR